MNRSPDRLNLCLSELKGAGQLKNFFFFFFFFLFIVVSRNDFSFTCVHMPEVYFVVGDLKSAWSFELFFRGEEYEFYFIYLVYLTRVICSSGITIGVTIWSF